MGGDSFEGVEKLTNPQYEKITSQLIQKLAPYCQKIQPYTPLPEKEVHGDVDFVMLTKDKLKCEDFIALIQPAKYKINNDNSFNMVYSKKQVDFVLVHTQNQFQLMHFYKSYSGLGGYLGVFFPSKILKVTHKGLFAPLIHFHLKLQFLVCDSVSKIMQFYGLDYERHKKGYKTRKQLYEYLRNVRFLDEEKYIEQVKLVKGTSKLMWGMVEYLWKVGVNKQKKVQHFADPLRESLQFFGKTKQFEEAWNGLLMKKKRQQEMSKKFNAVHLLGYFDIIPKQVDKLKQKFISIMFENDRQKYLDFVQSHSLQELLQIFGKVCQLKVKNSLKIKEEKQTK